MGAEDGRGRGLSATGPAAVSLRGDIAVTIQHGHPGRTGRRHPRDAPRPPERPRKCAARSIAGDAGRLSRDARNARGWVDERDGKICAFLVADDATRNIWALFVLREYERQGIGRRLHDAAVAWLREQSLDPIWLTTESHTRAERFYRAAGWREAGRTDRGEIRFELTAGIAD